MKKESFNLLLVMLLGVACLNLGATSKKMPVKINLTAAPFINSAKELPKQLVKPVSIEGYYKPEPLTESEEVCDLSVRIIKTKGLYYYTFNMAGKVYKGKVKLKKNAGSSNLGITFTGIKWAEYEGDISNTNDDDRPVAFKIPVGIEGMFSKNVITIQNSGNAMNYYVQIAQCGDKYIRLVKR